MHCNYCDGKDQSLLYVEEAVKKGFVAIGYSSHAPIPFKNDWTMEKGREGEYILEIAELKEKYKGIIQVYTGFELDFFDGAENSFGKYKCDFEIGSVHFFGDIKNEKTYSIDGTKEEFDETLNTLFDGKIEAFVRAYYRQMEEMVKEHQPDIIGHLDVIKKNNKGETYFKEDSEFYREAVLQLLTVISKSKSIVEINTGGMLRGYTDDTYPSRWIIQEMKKLDIPVVLNSDAHTAAHIDGYFEKAASILKSCGYLKQKVLLDGEWRFVEL